MKRYIFSGFLCGAVVIAAISFTVWSAANGAGPKASAVPDSVHGGFSFRRPPVPPAEIPIHTRRIAQAPAPRPSAPLEQTQPGIAVSVTGEAVETLDPPQAPQLSPTRPAPEAQTGKAADDTAAPAPVSQQQPPPPALTRKQKPLVSLDEMIGQMLIFGFAGTRADQKWPRAIAQQLATGTLGGVIFLRHNLANKADARRLMQALRTAGRKARHTPLYVLDQEGGRVQRLGAEVGVKTWPSPAAIARGTPAQAKKQYDGLAATLKTWGFNVNLGPVVDVNINPANPIIARLGRSYSADPAKVTTFSRTFIDAHRRRGILTSLKHFPGHGSSKQDSHLGFTDISRTWKSKKELAPYRDLINSGGVDMVMIGHLYLARYQAPGQTAKYPATLSRELVSGLLRGELGYDGVVISDDMDMGAIRKLYPAYDAAVMAISAGIDLLIVSNSAKPDIALPERYIARIKAAAEGDPRLRARIEQSYRRIVALKQRLRPD